MKDKRFQVDVLVVGAGPTGLTMAHELKRSGISCFIADKASGPSVRSKALAVQARTLELFTLMGVAQEFLTTGFKAPGVRLLIGGKEIARGDISGLENSGCRHSYVLVISQAETERILLASLIRYGASVEWDTECTSLLRNEGGDFPVLAAFRRKDGTTFSVHARYVVGSDGAHSFVRHQMAVEFEGGAYQQRFLLADARTDWPDFDEFLSVYLGDTGVCVFLPFEKSGVGRFILMDRRPESDEQPDAATIESEVQSYIGSRLRLKDFKWIAPFKLHHRCASSYQEDRMFLAGDAAHIHSPAGGQGMNTGIQDAFNLAWKLAFTCKGAGAFGLLDSYDAERRPIGIHLLQRTDRLFSAVSSGNRLYCVARNLAARIFAPIVLGRPELRERVFHFVSQLKIRYRRSPLVFDHSVGAPKIFLDALPPGNRLPDVRICSVGGSVCSVGKANGLPAEQYLYELLDGLHYKLLWLFPSRNQDIQKAITGTLSAFDPYLSHVVITNGTTRLERAGGALVFDDRFGEVARFFGGGDPSLLLVRPDSHIAVRVFGQDVSPVAEYFRIAHGR